MYLFKINTLAGMDRKKQDKVLRFIDKLLVKIVIFLIIVFWAFGYFILRK